MNSTRRISLSVSALGIVASLVFASCTDCRWVEDCRCKDGGYWDCPPAPVEPIARTPSITISIAGERRYNSNRMQTTFTYTVKNFGNGIAKNVTCRMKVIGVDCNGSMQLKTMVNETQAIGSIQPSSSATLTKSVSDVAVYGSSIYTVGLEVTCTDEQGKSYTSEQYIDY
ncbi:MAG: hypothetical protein U0264_12900 [Candidatus Kapaibacterium sp.]